MPAILTIEDAIAREQYVSPPQIMTRGDVGGALKRAPHRLKGELHCGGQDHFYLEGQIALAIPGDSGDFHIFSSTQHPTEIQHAVGHLLDIPFNAVTVEVRRMGGAFGGKESQATLIAGIAAVLANKAKRPVKLRLPRDDDMRATGKRHPFLIRYDVGFDNDGTIQALDLTLAANGGNVADHTSGRGHARALPCRQLLLDPGAALHRPAVQDQHGVEHGVSRLWRAAGHVRDRDHSRHDRAASSNKPLDEVRARNYYGETRNNVTPYGMTIEDNIIGKLTDEFARVVDLKGWRAEIDAFNAKNTIIKKGLASMPVKFGISFNRPTLNQAGALVHVYTDGSVTLNHGGTEMGQGLFVKVAQVVAEAFQIDIEHIRMSATTTGKVPNTSPTAASSGSDLNGMAALNAAEQIRERMADVAADHFGVPKTEITFAANRIFAGNRSISFPELAAMSWEKRVSLSATGFYRTPKIHWDFATSQGRPFYYFAYGIAASEVAIDTLTGETRVLRSELLQDCGQSLNPAIDLGQIEGAFVQGMGWLTCEELWWDEKGRLRTHGPSTYKIPGSRDVPPVFNARILADAPNREETVFRSKAVGEPPLMLAISVWLAIRDAIASVADHKRAPHLDAPATPERVLMAVDAIKAG